MNCYIGRLTLWDEKDSDFHAAASVETLMEFAFVAAVGGVGFEDVAIAGFQLFEDGGFVDDTGATVVG